MARSNAVRVAGLLDELIADPTVHTHSPHPSEGQLARALAALPEEIADEQLDRLWLALIDSSLHATLLTCLPSLSAPRAAGLVRVLEGARTKPLATRFALAAYALGAGAEIATVLAAARRARYVIRVPAVFGKLELHQASALAQAARTALEATTEDALDPWLATALYTVLAREGGEASCDCLARRARVTDESFDFRAFVIAALDQHPGPRTDALAEVLRGEDVQIVAESEAEQWRRSLKLELGDEWQVGVEVWDAPGDALVRPKGASVQLHLEIGAHLHGSWRVHVNRYTTTIESSSVNPPEGFTQNDLELPALQTLAELPAWLGLVEARLGTRFALENAWLFVGRKRSAAAVIRAWLGRVTRQGLV